MKYFIDTEFLEGTQNKTFLGMNVGKTKPTIDLISIGIVSEDNREYYAISKDFNLKEAWNRFDWKKKTVNDGIAGAYKEYWLRENILLPIHYELAAKEVSVPSYNVWKEIITKKENGVYGDRHYKTLKRLINKYGKTNKQIAEEIMIFVANRGDNKTYKYVLENEYLRDKPEFYAYYADYDWVAFCWLFGKMIDLPKGFPMFAFDIQQLIIDNNINKEQLLKEVPQTNCHNSLSDALWNKNAYNWIQNKINNGK